MIDLIKLAERVEAEESLSYNEILTPFGIDWASWAQEMRSPVISLDAAKVLHDAVLPGWDYLEMKSPTKERYTVKIREWFSSTTGEVKGIASSPAAAWVAAILRAKAVQDG